MYFRYPACLMRQTPEAKPLILFSAPATEIEQWAGVPQRQRLHGEETVGFQREESVSRVAEISAFFDNPRNIVQNPLLGALQSAQSVTFVPVDEDQSVGHVVIEYESVDDLKLLDLLRRLRDRLEQRLPGLLSAPIPQGRYQRTLTEAAKEHGMPHDPEVDLDDVDSEDDFDPSTDDPEDISGILLAEETRIVDFYIEIRTRIAALEKFPPQEDPDSIVGFTKEAVKSYLLPIVLVDGQHRLRGAVRAARASLETPVGKKRLMEALFGEGSVDPDEIDPDSLAGNLIKHNDRWLPMSLLMDDSPSEHVFQFVVVNQKATPMGKALLGTIVSTSLSKEELEPVAQRLRNAKIQLDDSRAVAYLTRAEESPFKGLVQTGIVGDNPEHLQWTVLKSLVQVFRELTGGKLYGQKNDYARKWRREFLPQSELVSEGDTDEAKFKIWSQADGPWRTVFIRFFTLVRDKFGVIDDMRAPNAWGSSRGNLFNMVSLTILAADYFEYLCMRKKTLNHVADVDATFEDWLDGVKDSYFAREWPLPTGMKKDQRPVKVKWASLWSEYRRDPSTGLPKVIEYVPK
ncbi:hypothetical protein AB0K12_32395 [Nonomuraea sp. NPDC049419]|uniref:hypothetical protein n=1 Tax=Nonomuraea sp. NPDC049419 TaxID=3155772 RepID=UPI00342D8155